MPDDCTYEELAHTADVGMRVRALTPEALFVCAARSLFVLLSVEPAAPTGRQRIVIEASDTEDLLVAWLNELLYRYETTGAVPAAIRMLHWSPASLEAEILSGPPAAPAHATIKAVTYHRLRVAEQAEGWEAEYFVDV